MEPVNNDASAGALSVESSENWNDARGRNAKSPSEIPSRGWRDIGWRVWAEANNDRIMLVSAGVTFYLLLALFPALAAFVSLYGLVADPKTIADHIIFLGTLLPVDGVEFIRAQIGALVSKNDTTLGFGFLFGLAVALWSANSGMKALFDVMNVAYEETEQRSFVMLNLLSMAFTMGAVLIWISFLLLVGLVPVLLSWLWLDRWAEQLVSIGRWPILVLMVLTGIATLYRYGPSREHAQWRWLTWGAALATAVWIIASAGFSFYLRNFADYNATYGSLGAVMGLMVWTWLSVTIVAIGAEINAEVEHQTARDTTTGLPLPMGERGATMADTLGGTSEKEFAGKDRARRALPAFSEPDPGTDTYGPVRSTTNPQDSLEWQAPKKTLK